MYLASRSVQNIGVLQPHTAPFHTRLCAISERQFRLRATKYYSSSKLAVRLLHLHAARVWWVTRGFRHFRACTSGNGPNAVGAKRRRSAAGELIPPAAQVPYGAYGP